MLSREDAGARVVEVDSYLDHPGGDILPVLPLDLAAGASGDLRAVVLQGGVGVGAVA